MNISQSQLTQIEQDFIRLVLDFHFDLGHHSPICLNDINDTLFECSINKPQDVQREILINKEKYVGKYMFVEYRERSGVAQVPFHARGINIES